MVINKIKEEINDETPTTQSIKAFAMHLMLGLMGVITLIFIENLAKRLKNQ